MKSSPEYDPGPEHYFGGGGEEEPGHGHDGGGDEEGMDLGSQGEHEEGLDLSCQGDHDHLGGVQHAEPDHKGGGPSHAPSSQYEWTIL